MKFEECDVENTFLSICYIVTVQAWHLNMAMTCLIAK